MTRYTAPGDGAGWWLITTRGGAKTTHRSVLEDETAVLREFGERLNLTAVARDREMDVPGLWGAFVLHSGLSAQQVGTHWRGTGRGEPVSTRQRREVRERLRDQLKKLADRS